MNTLEKIENLAERLAGKIEYLADNRRDMFLEISELRGLLIKRDKEAVKAAQEMRAELEAARVDALRFEQGQARINVKLQGLNDRLVLLASSAGSPGEEHFGG